MKALPYLNFPGTAAEAMEFYKSVLGGEFVAYNTFGDAPASDDMPPLPDDVKAKIMHITLSFEGGSIMASDNLEGMAPRPYIEGSNCYVALHPETVEEGQRIYDALSKDAKSVEMAFAPMFWGAHFASFVDRFGTSWMINVITEAS